MLAPSPVPIRDKEYFKSLAIRCAKYRGGDDLKSITQPTTTLSLFAAAISALYLSVTTGTWLAYALLLLPTAGLLVRVFVIQQNDLEQGGLFDLRTGGFRDQPLIVL